MDFVFRRWYRSQVSYDGPLGHGWDFELNARLVSLGGGHPLFRWDGAPREVHPDRSDHLYFACGSVCHAHRSSREHVYPALPFRVAACFLPARWLESAGRPAHHYRPEWQLDHAELRLSRAAAKRSGYRREDRHLRLRPKRPPRFNFRLRRTNDPVHIRFQQRPDRGPVTSGHGNPQRQRLPERKDDRVHLQLRLRRPSSQPQSPNHYGAQRSRSRSSRPPERLRDEPRVVPFRSGHLADHRRDQLERAARRRHAIPYLRLARPGPTDHPDRPQREQQGVRAQRCREPDFPDRAHEPERPAGGRRLYNVILLQLAGPSHLQDGSSTQRHELHL